MTSPSEHQRTSTIIILVVCLFLLAAVTCCCLRIHRRRLYLWCVKKKGSYNSLTKSEWLDIKDVFDEDEDLEGLDFEMGDFDTANRSVSSLSNAVPRGGYETRGNDVKLKLDFSDIERTPAKSIISNNPNLSTSLSLGHSSSSSPSFGNSPLRAPSTSRQNAEVRDAGAPRPLGKTPIKAATPPKLAPPPTPRSSTPSLDNV